MRVRRAVRRGDVAGAVERVNDLDPGLLESRPPLLFRLHCQRLVELVRAGDAGAALAFAEECLAPAGEEHPELLEELGERPRSCTSSLVGLLCGLGFLRRTSVVVRSRPPPPKNTPNTPKPKPKTTERAMALLAFEDPASSPLGELLSPAQRERTAAQLNAAVLSATGQEREARLPGLLRLVLWAQRQLAERAEFPRVVDLATARLSSDPEPSAAAGGGGGGAAAPS